MSTLDYEPISDPFAKLKNTRLKNPNRLIIAQLNINSLRNKFDSLVPMLHNNLDILLISETKIDSSFPTVQFQVEGYTTYRLDRNANGGGILLYIREDIPSTLLNFDMPIESLFIEINIRKKKWLLVGTYNPNKNLISNHLKDCNLTFENHIRNICKKASQKLNALARIAPYMNIQKRRTIMKSFVTSQFSYCPLIWMFHSRRLNNKINSIHERALRITYQDNTSTFQELLNKDNSVSIHHRNLQVLATEMFKVHRGLFPEILRETFVSKTSSYNLRRNDTFGKRKVHSVYHGTESLSFLGPKIWDLVPVGLKQSETLYPFKLKIKNWVLFEYPYRICKTYIQQVGFL